MAASLLSLVALALVTLHVSSAASVGPGLRGASCAPDRKHNTLRALIVFWRRSFKVPSACAGQAGPDRAVPGLLARGVR